MKSVFLPGSHNSTEHKGQTCFDLLGGDTDKMTTIYTDTTPPNGLLECLRKVKLKFAICLLVSCMLPLRVLDEWKFTTNRSKGSKYIFVSKLTNLIHPEK